MLGFEVLMVCKARHLTVVGCQVVPLLVVCSVSALLMLGFEVFVVCKARHLTVVGCQVVPLLVVCSVSALLMLGFEVFVVCKARQTAPSRRHLFLGQTLLLGLLLCAAVAAVAAATPTPAVCATIRMGAGVSYAVVFSALLVKCVFLISLNGGVYLPAAYQALLLAFAVLTQVAVGVQWLLASPPAAELRPLPPLLHGGGERWVWSCRSPYAHLVASLSYCGALLLLVAVLAVKSRAIRDNYREATFIGLSAGAAVLIAAAWLLAGLLLATPPQRDACVAFGLVATAAVVFLVMFMPKGRQLAAMGRDGLYAEDRDDRLSSLSRAASPSFFHFTPAHHPQPPPPPPPHKAPVPPGLTDQVAVVGQVPSYARMLHYYPYCYYPRYACPCTPAPAPAPAPLPNSGDQYHAGAAPRWKSGLYLKPDDSNLYTTVEPTLSSNPNVFFQRSGLHPGLIY
ncbi:uncharacterized protein LOC124580219 [Schistocerca americana]|uniref:uncharacterized protein LOC124580219 n=1 Tax=Schistocerca americana TaxID=7009 RepID=UPI001F4FB6E7|nr:uncharacterized protein LOC124580219 [Schistocerca americana]